MLLLSSQLMVYMCALVGFSYLLSVVFLQSAFSRISSTTFIFHLITIQPPAHSQQGEM